MTILQLNKQQERAVTHTGTPLLVAAGPGSGKTGVIIERVNYLIENQEMKPSQILCLTFSDKAAEEMRDRIEERANTSDVESATFHAFCLGILDETRLEAGISFKSGLISRNNQLVWGLQNIDKFNFEYITVGNNAVEVIESIIDGISAFRDELVSPAQLKEYLDKRKTELFTLQKTLENSEPQTSKTTKSTKTKKQEKPEVDIVDVNEELAFINKLIDLHKVYEKYEQFKRKESLIDFDDMIHVVIDLFKKKPEVLKRYQDRYGHVLVDEFQDNNYAQLELVKLLCPSGNVTVVGDDDQSIYRFRGAYLTVFDDFKDYYKNVEIINLERNYRSTKNIVALAKQLLDPVPNRIKKNLFSDNEDGSKIIIARCSTDAAESDFVIKKIKDLLGKNLKRRDGSVSPITYKDIVILSRRRFEGLKFAGVIRSQGLPCTFVGESRIFSTPIVRDLLAYLRVSDDPLNNGVELMRIMLGHGVSEQNVKIINHYANAKTRRLMRKIYDKDTSQASEIPSRSDDMDKSRNYGTDFVYDVLEEITNNPSSEIAKDITQKNSIIDIFNQIKSIISLRNSKSVSDFTFDLVMKNTDLYKRTIRDDSIESIRNRTILHEFLNIAQEFESIMKNGTLKQFLNHIDLMSDFDIELKQGDDQSDSITVTTIHKSKGKEFPIVFVVDLAKNKLPLIFREKQFYCPSPLARGLKFKNMDEKELYKQEERRLFYVAMTRAQHHLFITYAEIYGNRVTKAKPSEFLIELDFENNSLVELASHEVENTISVLATDNSLEQLRNEYQLLASKMIDSMQLKSAIEKIVELAAIVHFQQGKPLSEFKLSDVLSGIGCDLNILQSQLKSEQVQLVDKDKIHFSATALKTYQDCPLQYKFSYIMKAPKSSKPFFDLGTTVHSVVEVLTKRQIEDPNYLPTEKDALELLENYWVSSSYDNSKSEHEDRESAEKMLKFFVNWCKERKDAGNKPIAAEQEFDIDVCDKKMIGFIDRIDLTPDGNYEVYDYKTGRSELSGSSIKKDIQVNAYSLAVKKNLESFQKKCLFCTYEKRKNYHTWLIQKM